MANYATPILYLNMGGEMLYVLQQRLQSQQISTDKTIQVMSDVITALLKPSQVEPLFKCRPLMTLAELRPCFESVILSSIMRLDATSMNKLFDLMIMMVKYQLATATGPREIILSTLNHLDAIRDMSTIDPAITQLVDATYHLLMNTYGNMTHKEIWQIRNDCLNELQPHHVRVSILLRLGMQNEDASFNLLIQRYDEQYRERRSILENVRLLDYAEEDSDKDSMGSLDLIGDRITLLGQNVYAKNYGLLKSSSSSKNLQQLGDIPMVSNKAIRRELDTLGAQLGKEEVTLKRPFSLHLFTQDSDGNNMDCSPDELKLDDKVQNIEEKEKENSNNNSFKSKDINDYKNELINKIDSEFDDNEITTAHNEAMDLMNMLDIM